MLRSDTSNTSTLIQADDDPLLAWRKQTLRLLLRLQIFIVVPLTLIGSANDIRLGRWYLLLFSWPALIVLIGLTIARPHDYRLRGMLSVGYCLFMFLVSLSFLGLHSVGPGIMFVIAVLAILLLDLHTSIIFISFGISGVVLILSSFGLGLMPYPHEPARHANEWMVLINNMFLIAGVSTVLAAIVRSVVTALQTSFQTTRSMLSEVERMNNSLEEMVEQRTAEIQRTTALLQASQRLARVGGSAYDPEQQLLTWTDELYRIHEVPLGTIVDPQLLERLYPGESCPILRQAIYELLSNGTPYDIELSGITLSGRSIWVRAIGIAESVANQTYYFGAVQDITARKEAELRVEEQLRYAQALAHCSRILLTPVKTHAEFQQTITRALDVMRETVGGDRITIAQYASREAGEAQMLQSFRILAISDGPALPPQRRPTFEELRDMPPVLNVWQQGGGSFNGSLAEHLEGHPIYKRYNDDNRMQSAFIQALDVAGRWWGHILITDHHQVRCWSDDAIQLIRTATEMIVTFTEGWDAVQALQERETLLREMGQMAQIGGWSVDRATRSIQWSEQVYTIHELEVNTLPLSAEESLNFYVPEARPVVEGAIITCMREGKPWDLEVPLVTAKGRQIWVRAQGQAVYQEGQVVRVRGTIQDITASKKAELALAANEAKYRALFALLPTGVTLADLEGQIVEVNPAAERLLGIRADAHQTGHIDEPAWDIIQPDGTPFPLEAFPSVRAPRESQVITDVEMGVSLPDGRHVWLSVSAAPLTSAPFGVVVAYTDITARKNAELALSAELRYAEALAHCSRILLAASTDVLAWEPVAELALTILREVVGCTRLAINLYPSSDKFLHKLSGDALSYDPNDPPNQELPLNLEDIPPEMLADIRRGDYIAVVPQKAFPEGSILRSYCDVNGIQSFLAMGILIGGDLRGYFCASDRSEVRVWDEPTIRLLRTGLEMITAFLYQWETANVLRTREAQLRALGDNLPNGFMYQYRYDREYRPSFTYLSSGVTRVLNVSPEAVIANPSVLHSCVAPEERERLFVAEQRSFQEMSVFAEVLRHILADGSERWLYICSRPRPTSDGSVVWDGLALDVTEQQRVAEELTRARDAAEAATRAKSAFLASMSHEIRTPLNAVIGMAALLRDSELHDEQRVFVDTIHTGGQALLSVINDILDFSRIESGHMEIDSTPFDLLACLSSAVDLISHTAHQKGLRVGWTCGTEVPKAVVGDASRLRQVLLNLLGNAVKFTSQGEIILHASAAPYDEETALVKISVRDTGIGMSPEQIERIFAPFVQADSSTARRYGGTGLGLTISRQLLTLMGGTIEVTSLPNVGTTFTMYLPLHHASQADLPRPIVLEQSEPRRLRVLVAEDNPINQEVTRRMVTRLGHTVTVVADGQAAVEAVCQQPYDVVLMDVQMPILDGESAAREIRQRGASIVQPRIIALTANALDGDQKRVLEAGMDDYLSKPVQLTELKQALLRADDGPLILATQAVAPEPPAESLIQDQVLDYLITSLGSDGRMAVASLMRLFEEVLPPQLDAIEAALAQGDLAQIKRLAHRLRGGCMQLGAQAMGNLCMHLEGVHTLEEVTGFVAQLRTTYNDSCTLLRERYPDI